jgi:hypothetical protein
LKASGVKGWAPGQQVVAHDHDGQPGGPMFFCAPPYSSPYFDTSSGLRQDVAGHVGHQRHAAHVGDEEVLTPPMVSLLQMCT